MQVLLTSIAFCISLLLGGGNNVTEANRMRATASSLRQGGDYGSALQYLEKALVLRPDHPGFMYEIAQLNQLLGRTDEALSWLRRIMEMGLVYHPERDSVFTSLLGRAQFLEIVAIASRNALPIRRSAEAFRLGEHNPISEGIAYDAATDRFFISSVRERRILVRSRSGEEKTFLAQSDSVWGVLGVRADEKRGILWACTAVLPQIARYDSAKDGMSALLKIDLRNGNLLKLFTLGNSEEKHLLGDLTVTPAGDVYITDSRSPVIYRYDHQTEAFEEYVRSDEFVNLQGIDYSVAQGALYVADYSRGIFHVDVLTREVTLLPPFDGTTLLGIDGLYVHGKTIVAIQNGINPNRVVKCGLDDLGVKVVSSDVLEANHHLFDEPTLGLIAGNEFFYIANSQWEKGGKPTEKTVILKLKLKQ